MDVETLEQLDRFARGENSLEGFEDWFIEATWEADSPLIRAIQHAFVEPGSSDEVKDRLVEVARRAMHWPLPAFGSVAARVSHTAGSSTTVVVGRSLVAH